LPILQFAGIICKHPVRGRQPSKPEKQIAAFNVRNEPGTLRSPAQSLRAFMRILSGKNRFLLGKRLLARLAR
jgi:hypothetical protein